MKLTKENVGEIAVGKNSEIGLSLDDLMRMAVIESLTSEPSKGSADPCPQWALVLHAFFDGELDAADSVTCEQHLAQCHGCFLEVEKLKLIRRKIERFALGGHARTALPNRSGR